MSEYFMLLNVYTINSVNIYKNMFLLLFISCPSMLTSLQRQKHSVQQKKTIKKVIQSQSTNV